MKDRPGTGFLGCQRFRAASGIRTLMKVLQCPYPCSASPRFLAPPGELVLPPAGHRALPGRPSSRSRQPVAGDRACSPGRARAAPVSAVRRGQRQPAAVLLARAMDHYKLARRQVITYAFLEEPGSRAKHARLRNGPMRYSRYKLIVFVLTSDGVRQMSADLGFVAVTLRLGDRISYRYDAVASAHVSLTRSGPPKPRIQQKFTLTLVNGDPISVIVRTSTRRTSSRERTNIRSPRPRWTRRA